MMGLCKPLKKSCSMDRETTMIHYNYLTPKKGKISDKQIYGLF